MCIDFVKLMDNATCLNNTFTVNENGTCMDVNGTVKAIWDVAVAKGNKIERRMPTEEFFE